MNDGSRIVYSTGPDGKITCPRCNILPCECPAGPNKERKQTEPVRIFFRKTGKGSGLTLIEKLPMHPQGKEELLKKFKKRLGVGGTVKFGTLELQGDQRKFARKELESAGYKLKIIP